MIKTFVEWFIIGITLSFGPCLFSCSPLILPYIAATQKGAWGGLKTIFIFSLTRLTIYVFLGYIAASIGIILMHYLQTNRHLLNVLGGSFISAMGIFILFGIPKFNFCNFMKKHLVENKGISVIFLGIIAGLSPCPPLLGVLGCIVLISKRSLEGAIYGLAFGAGTFISPLLLLGVFAGMVPHRIVKSENIQKLFIRICSVILVIMGIQLIFLP